MKTLAQSIIFSCIFFSVFSSCNSVKSIYVNRIENTQNTIDDSYNSVKEIDDIILPYKYKIEGKMNEVIGVVDKELIKEQPESSLGNFNADAILYSARKHSKDTVHVAISNYGGMRIPSIASGDLKLGTIYELMPFDNMLVVVEMNGEVLKQYLTHTIYGGGWPISKGISIIADTTNLDFQFKINNEEIVDSFNYRVCTSDYLANGGDKCDFMKALQYEALGVFFREGLIEYVENLTSKKQKVNSLKEQRFQYAK